MKETRVAGDEQKPCLPKILYYSYESEINQKGILQLNLIELFTTRNKKIKNVNYMKNTLKILNCSYESGIDQNSIFELNLIKLIAINNKKIKFI